MTVGILDALAKLPVYTNQTSQAFTGTSGFVDPDQLVLSKLVNMIQ